MSVLSILAPTNWVSIRVFLRPHGLARTTFCEKPIAAKFGQWREQNMPASKKCYATSEATPQSRAPTHTLSSFVSRNSPLFPSIHRSNRGMLQQTNNKHSKGEEVGDNEATWFVTLPSFKPHPIVYLCVSSIHPTLTRSLTFTPSLPIHSLP
jgi:hypothetical protein